MTDQALDLPLPQAPAERPLSTSPPRQLVSPRLLIGAFLALFATITIVCAWLGDDAYITFRTVENFFNGYGLRSNVAERVQAYTHPLWMLVLLAGRGVTGEFYFTSIALSLALSWTTVWLLATRLATSTSKAVLAVVLLTVSRAFVDFSTSGLENPLSHLILVLFLLRSFTAEAVPRHLFQLSLLACLGMLNRLDLALIFMPTLALWLVRARSWRAAGTCLIAFLPLALWEAFSLAYYGFPFPNTAYAKLGNGISTPELLKQGGAYFLWMIMFDMVTLFTIFFGLGCTLVYPRGKRAPAVAAAAGAFLYLLYVTKIGGDFMGGRFMAAPLLVGVSILARNPLPLRPRDTLAGVALAVTFASLSPHPTFLAGGEGGAGQWIDYKGVVNERLFYYGRTGLLYGFRHGGLDPNYQRVKAAREHIDRGEFVISDDVMVGMLGLYGGPRMHIIDPVALTEPLLARLPAKPGTWRIGHFERTIPDGYVETIRTGRNVIQDPSLAEFYNRLSLVTRGPLWSRERWKEIWRFNTGGNQHLVEEYLKRERAAGKEK